MTPEQRARWIVQMAQGTMALEGQAVSSEFLDGLVERTTQKLTSPEVARKRSKKMAGQKKQYVKSEDLDSLVGKTVEAVGTTSVEGAYGEELATVLYFSDGTYFVFVHPADE